MESVINKLAEIETAATKIMQAAENQKKLQDEQQEERIAKFDADLEAETAKRIEEITTNFILLQMRIRKSSGTLPPNFYLHWTLITNRITEHCPRRFTKTLVRK